MLLGALLLAATAAAAPNSTGDVTYDVTQQEIAALEQVKEALYQQLQGAIAETVQSLNRSGDAAALSGLMQLQDRLQSAGAPARRRFNQEKLIGAGYRAEDEQDEPAAQDGLAAPAAHHDHHYPRSDHKDHQAPLSTSPAPVSETDLRKAQRIKDAKYWYEFFNLGDLAKLQLNEEGFVETKMKGKTTTPKGRQALNKKYVLQRLRDWILMKQEEKRKIREYKMQQSVKNENCPRWGSHKKNVYPCCRKCCKSSYLGCL